MKMKAPLRSVGIMLLLATALPAQDNNKSAPSDNAPITCGNYRKIHYIDHDCPAVVPEVFARGIVSTDNLEHSAPAFSPDGSEVFWSVWRRPEKRQPQAIMGVRRNGNAWSTPAVAPFSGRYSDGGPVFSPDGVRIYFHSSRPRPGEPGENEGDIWFVEKQGGGWSKPKYLGLVARFRELQFAIQPSLVRNGTLYFVGPAREPQNGFGIYRSRFIDGQYARPELLPARINLPPFLNWTPFVARDESFLLFSSNRRSPETDGGDLWISHRRDDGSWGEPVMLDRLVNSGRQERFPMLSPDGKGLFFTRTTSGREQDVYWVSARVIELLQNQTDVARAAR
jgi:hypothetical protein